MSETSDLIRNLFGEGDAKRDSGLTTPNDIERFDDIVYGELPEWQSLDVYRPKNTEGKLPVIVSVHGGGWVYGNKEGYQWYCMNLAQRGFAVVNFTYRLAPEFKFPASLEDTNSVFTFVMENAEKYGFDTDNIFAVGDSAGAHNLGLYASISSNPDYAANFSFKAPKNFSLRAIALNCGAYVIDLPKEGEEPTQTQMLMWDLLPNKGTAEELELINVTKHITPNYPETFFMTATGDFLRGDAPKLREALDKNNVPYTFHYYVNKELELPHVFHCNIKDTVDAKKCNDDECSFFKSRMI